MEKGDLYRFRKPLVHYLSEYEGRLFIVTEIKCGIGDQTVYDIRMVDNLKLWTFTGHELAYIAEKV